MVNFTPTTLTDKPVNPHEKRATDDLGIEKYIKGLVKFLERTATPITIALQGEWGSGKTSLMYSLQDSLCETKDGYLGIWINSWEFALLREPSEMLAGVLNSIISQILSKTGADSSTKQKILGLGKKFAKVAIKTTAGVFTSDSSAVEDLFDGEKDSTLSQLRAQLIDLINSYCAKHSDCRGFMFFIDDLDRINPSAAVELLELMKNIFTIEHCVFILAIDYEVVVKGLQPKFGERTDENEREFRSFFDKIIQVPFSMPVDRYTTGNFIKRALVDLNYMDQSEVEQHSESIIAFTERTVGNNPRSIKRLLNTLSLINCISGEDSTLRNSDKNKLLNYAFTALMVVYPKFYTLLSQYPEFTAWSRQTIHNASLRKLSSEDKEALKALYDDKADEQWERTIMLICETEVFLKRNFFNISSVFNLILKQVEQEGSQEDNRLIDTERIREVLALSATASIEPTISLDPDQQRKEVIDSLYQAINLRLKSVPYINWKTQRNTGKGAYTLAFPGTDRKFKVNLRPLLVEDGICLDVWSDTFDTTTDCYYDNKDNINAAIEEIQSWLWNAFNSSSFISKASERSLAINNGYNHLNCVSFSIQVNNLKELRMGSISEFLAELIIHLYNLVRVFWGCRMKL